MASTVLSRLAKRRCYPVPIDDEKIYVRALTFGQLRDIETLPGELAGSFIFGCGVISDAGAQEIPSLEGESNLEYATRVSDILVDREIPVDTVRDVNAAIMKLMRVPQVEDIAKNS